MGFQPLRNNEGENSTIQATSSSRKDKLETHLSYLLAFCFPYNSHIDTFIDNVQYFNGILMLDMFTRKQISTSVFFPPLNTAHNLDPW